jgi:hypothetical protein
MTKEFNFHFADLVIDQQEIAAVLGYKNEPLPSPFGEYLKEALLFASTLTNFKATYTIQENISANLDSHSIWVKERPFHVGKTVYLHLKDAEKMALFVCTVGETISEKSTALLHGDAPVLGYVYDVLGSCLVEAVANKMQQALKADMEVAGFKTTNRYSPGYCQWSVADQHQLFSFFEPSPCGVTLTPSALMHPIKSVSGIIGIGTKVKHRNYQCKGCTTPNCSYREAKL